MLICRMTIAAFTFAAAGSFAAEALNAKIGLWEMTYTTETSGNMIPKAALDKMPPDQRAKIEALMKQRAAGGAQTRTHKSCVTKEDLQKGVFGDSDDKQCAYKWLAETRTKREGSFQCAGDSPRTGTVKFEVAGGDKVQGDVQIVGESSKLSMKMSGHWRSADCKGADD
jgi:Protein of unknown function (DUF3617)